MRRIFEKFFQVPDSGPKGTGLGSVYREGNCPRARGRYRRGERTGEGEHFLVHGSDRRGKPRERGRPMNQPSARILVADDERNIRKNLAMVLESAGYQVDEARDGEEALALCRETHPDIAFVDLHMPKMEGLDVLAHFRTLSPKTAVVIITAYGSAANAVEAMKLGAVDFLEKPFDPKIIGILAEEILFRQRHGIRRVIR